MNKKVEEEFDKALDSQNQTILIIDDEPANLAVVADYLAQSGFQIKVSQTGEAGLELARRTPPALILLDVQLPGVDGFEVCRRLKADEQTRDIPVIFMTIVTRTEDKVRGFEVGGVDYITKPFQYEEVLARVTIHLALRAVQKQLAAQNARLQQEITERKQAEEALAQEQYLMQALMDNVPDYIYFKDRESRFTRTSKSHAQAFGLSDPAQAVGKTDFDFFTEEHARPAYEDEQQIIHTGQPITKEERETWADRPDTWVLTTKLPLRDEANNIVGTFGISKDITERKRAEAALRESETRYHRLFEQTQATLAETQALYRVSRSVIALESLAEMLQTAVDAVADALPANRVALITFDLEAQQVTHFVRGGLGADHMMRVPFDELWNGLVGWVLRESKPALSSKSSPDPRESLEAQRRRAETNCGDIIVAPLRYQDKTLGTLTAINLPDEREFTEHDVELMMAMTSQAAMAIENARLYEELQLAHAELERRVEERTAELVQANARLTEEIAERKRTEEALRESEGRYRLLAENATDIIFTMGLDLRFTYISPSVTRILGYTIEEAMANTLDQVLMPASLERTIQVFTEELAIEASKSKQLWRPRTLELEQICKDGSTIWTETTLAPLRDSESQAVGVIGITRDITERKRAEGEIHRLNQELEQRVRDRTFQLETTNKELEAFAYSVSHDLRAPVRHIDGFIEMLQSRSKTTLDDQSQHYMEVIADSARKMGSLIDDILSFSRMGRNEMSKSQVDLDELIQDVIQELGPETEGRDIQWKISPLPLVTADRAMLRVVLVNLISNALKFTRPRKNAQIEIGYEKKDETEVVIFVRDNGVGFDMNYADKLFGVFQRLHRQEDFEGTGIGLANVRRIISRHGGRTWVEGEMDHGATFYFSLPNHVI